MTAENLSQIIRKELAQRNQLEVSDLEIELLHPEQIPYRSYKSEDIRIETDSKILQPGIRRVWIIKKNANRREQRRAIFVKVAVWREVLVAANDLAMNTHLRPENVRTRRVLLKHQETGLITNRKQLENKMTKQRVYAGDIMTDHMIKDIPDILRGDPVKIKIAYGNIVIETEGRVNQEARVGEPVSVVCEHMRQKLSGVLISSDMVHVQIR